MDEKQKDFKNSMKEADDLYAAGKYEAARNAANKALEVALEIAKETGNDEYSADALNRRAWSERYAGFKSDNSKVQEEMHESARVDWQEVLFLSKNLKTRISAIKGLILLPDAKIENLYKMGREEIRRSQQELENLKAELINSQALEIRKTNPLQAFHKFQEAYKIVEHGITIAGHMEQNMGVCWLMLVKDEKHSGTRKAYFERAIKHFEQALAEYPKDQIEHRKSTEKKLANAEKEIEQIEKTKTEKK